MIKEKLLLYRPVDQGKYKGGMPPKTIEINNRVS